MMHQSILVVLMAATAQGFSPISSPSTTCTGLGKIGDFARLDLSRVFIGGVRLVRRRVHVAAGAGVPVFDGARSLSVFDGAYTDPYHPGCFRTIQSTRGDAEASLENIVQVTGKDGSGKDGDWGCSEGGSTQTVWRLSGKVKGDQILVDFSPKGGPKNLVGKWEGDGIRWEDSNKWTKVSGSVLADLCQL
jgi:hypothetical protein